MTRLTHRLLFPPFTGLSCVDCSERGPKKLAVVSAQVSTARPDTREIDTPATVPGTAASIARVVTLLGTTAEEVLAYEEWNLDTKNLSSSADQEAFALLLGRASSKAPKLRVVSAAQAQLGKDGAKRVADALIVNKTLTRIK